MTGNGIRRGAVVALAAALVAGLCGCAGQTGAAGPAIRLAAAESASSAKGCAPNRVRMPHGDVSTIGDVDGDGRPDRQFYSLESQVYGIRTASGATILLHDNLPGPNQHGGWTARTETGVYTVIDDSRTAEVFRFTGCRFVPQHTRYGLPTLATLSDDGYGPRPSDQVRYGVTCTDQNGGRLLAADTAIKQDDGRWQLDWTVFQQRSGNVIVPDRNPSVAYPHLAASDHRVRNAGGSRCGTLPKVFSDGK